MKRLCLAAFALLLLPIGASPAASRPPVVILMGASNTSAVSVPSTCGAIIINDGVGGINVASYLPLAATYLGVHPDVAVISLSVNDTIGQNLSNQRVATYVANLTALVDQVLAAKAYPVLMTLTPVDRSVRLTYDMAAEARMNAAIVALARSRHAGLVDAHAGFVGKGGYMKPGLAASNGVHFKDPTIFTAWLQAAAQVGLRYLRRCS